MEVRKAAAAEGLSASMCKPGKKKPSRRPHLKASSSETSGDEALRKRRRGSTGAPPVTLPLLHPLSPSRHSRASDTRLPETPRVRAPSARPTDTEMAWSQVYELRSLVEEQQNVIRQMQLAAVDSAPLRAHAETAHDPVDAPCHAAFMAFLGCEASTELKEHMPVEMYMTFMAKKQCREWWVRKTEALLDKVDIGEETPRREMVSHLWRKFHDVVST